MEKLNLLTVIMSIVLSVSTVYIMNYYILANFIKKLSKIDEEYRIKMLDAVIKTVSSEVNGSKSNK